MTDITIDQQQFFIDLKTALCQSPGFFENAGTVTAELHVTGSVFISGCSYGNIYCHAGMVVVAPGAEVHGSIHAPELLLAGRLQGDCKVDRLVMKASGVLCGVIQTHLLIVEPGARFEGQSQQVAQRFPTYRSHVLPTMAQQQSLRGADAVAFVKPPLPRSWLWVRVGLVLTVVLCAALLLLFCLNLMHRPPAKKLRPALPARPAAQLPAAKAMPTRSSVAPAAPPLATAHHEISKTAAAAQGNAASGTRTKAQNPQPKSATAITASKLSPKNHPAPERAKTTLPVAPEASAAVDSRARKSLVPTAKPRTAQAAAPTIVQGQTVSAGRDSQSEVQTLIALEKLESRVLDGAVAQSTQAVGRQAQHRQIIAQIKRHASQLMQLRALLRRYAPSTKLLPYRPNAAVASDRLADANQTYRRQLQAALSQLDLASMHPDTRQLINRLSQSEVAEP